MKLYGTILLVFLSVICLAQPTSEKDWLSSFQARKQMADQSLLRNYPARNVGPTVQGGRIVDMEVNLSDPKEFYVGYASGGIFKTSNNGITFSPIFDDVDVMGIGDFALSQTDTKVMYVGTGEKNGSRSSYAGTGVYKTTDGGKTWTSLGLAATHHISRVLIHPQDNNTVWVAALGALYSNNPERGIFKTTDGGKTWRKTLYINDSTGISDLVVNPLNPRQLLASSWERFRKSSDFKGSGVGSAIYKSDDGGETWTKSVSGFPQGKFVGRIGLDICWTKPNVVYAVLDNQEETKTENKVKEDGKLKLTDFKEMPKDKFLAIEDKKFEEFLRDNGFPKKYSSTRVKKDIREGKYTPSSIASYFGGDANSNLFNTKNRGAEVYRSDDGGVNWKRTHAFDIDGVYFTYGYYFSEMRVAPDNADELYIYGVPVLKSRDGGKQWTRIDTLGNVHVDHHAIWINPKDSKHILLGNDGGLYQSYDGGAYWIHINNMPVGQFYTINVDMETPYNIYGGLQDNGVLKGSSRSVPNRTRHWDVVSGGDGMYVAADWRNSRVVYSGFQFGNYNRYDQGKGTRVTPQHDIGEQPYRWNWRTPLMLSRHNQDIVYMAANKVFRSLDRGDNWEVISPDLTKNLKQGNVPISTIASLNESPLQFGLLYAGTDDGNLWISKDAGGNWENISGGLPPNKWISSVTPSSIDKATVFVSVNGYRDDDFKTYIYMSADYGKTWRSIKGNLPESVANVVIQDPVNADLLYCGLDNGTYVSLDRGNSWHFFNKMLNVSSYDMMVHPRDNELVVGTHGRSVYVADVKPLQALKDGGHQKAIVAFAPSEIRFSDRWGEKQYEWSTAFEPKSSILYYVGKASASIKIEIYDDKNNLVRTIQGSGDAGFQSVNWDVKVTQTELADKGGKAKSNNSPATTFKYAGKGKYKVKLINDKDSAEVSIEIK